ncbi:hypothetical protein ABPG77_007486 [Micractinium sp. CCAP 211/92]
MQDWNAVLPSRTGGGSQSWSARGSTESEPSTFCHAADVLMWECSFGLPPGRSWEETPDGSNSATGAPVPSPPRGHPAGSPATAESQASLQAWHGRCTDQLRALQAAVLGTTVIAVSQHQRRC